MNSPSKRRSTVRRALASALSLLMLLNLLSISALAATTYQSGDFKYQLDSANNATIVSYSGTDTALTIPSRLDGVKVVAIADGAFRLKSTLKNVYFPNTLTTIGNMAFMACTGLTEVTIPGSVATIGTSAFSACTKLTEVTILYGVKTIKDAAFNGCTSLKKVVMGETTTAFPGSNKIFNAASALTEVQAPSGSTIDEYVGLDNKILNVTPLADDSPAAYEYVIDENTGEIIIEGYHSDSTKPSLPPAINGATVTGVAADAFKNAPITQVTLPPTIKTIGANAFAGTGLTEIELPDSVIDIASGAFDDNSNLTIKGSSTALDEYLKTSKNIKFTPYGANVSKYHLLTLQKTPAGGGEITVGISRSYREGTEIDLKAVPKQTEYLFNGWTTSPSNLVSGIDNPNLSQAKLIMPKQDVTVTANFGIIPPELLVIRDGVVQSYHDRQKTLVIPMTYGKTGQQDPNKVTVYKIASSAFVNGYAEEISLTDQITVIENQAFYNAQGLKRITVPNNNTVYSDNDGVLLSKDGTTLYCYPVGRTDASYTVPNGVTKIDAYAFSGNPYLTEINLNGVTTIGGNAFQGCSKLNTITFGSVERIGDNAFSRCGFTNLTLPEGLSSLGSYAFDSNTALTSVTLPKSLGSIGNYAFQRCGLINLNLPEGLNNIGSYAFAYNTALTGVSLPNSLQTIGSYAFSGDSKLDDVVLPDSLTSLGSYAFYQCSGLKTVYLSPDIGIQEIPAYCFYGCAFTKVNIPTSISSIASSAFSNNNMLAEINVEEGNTKYASQDGVLMNSARTTLITYPVGKADLTYKIPDTITTIDTSTFAGAKLNTIDLANVKTIGSNAFSNSKLTSVQLDGITSLGSSAFSNCTSLTTATILAKINTIGTEVFKGCTGLNSVTLPDSLTSIGNSAFYGCSNLTSITIPEGVTSIGTYAFSSCGKLASTVLPSSLAAIGAYAFSGDTKLATVNMPTSLTSIGSYAFYNCAITQLALPNGLKNIDSYAFQNCGALKSVTIPSSVTSIGSYAFYNCSLETVTFDNCAASIGDSAFRGGKFTTITLPSTLKTVGSYAFSDNAVLTTAEVSVPLSGYAFSNCKNLVNLTLREGVSSIGSYAFANTAVTNVQLPASLNAFGQRVFNNTPLVAYTIADGSKSFSAVDGVLLSNDGTSLISYPSNHAGDSYTTPSSVTGIKTLAFENAANLTTVILDEGVATLESSLFTGTKTIHTIKILNREATFYTNTQYPNDFVFTGMGNLNRVQVCGYSNSTTEYEVFKHSAQGLHFVSLDGQTEGVLVNTSGVVVGYVGSDTTVVVPSVVTKDTTGITLVDENMNPIAPDESTLITVTTIGANALQPPQNTRSIPVSQIVSVKLPLSVTTIKTDAFQDCTSLSDITLPISVRTIEPYAFRNCTALTSITIPRNVGIVGENGVYDDETITSVHVSAFYGCTNLTEILVEEGNSSYSSVDGVLANAGGNHIFEVPMSCPGNVPGTPGKFEIPSTVISIGASSFSGTSLNEVIVPSSVLSIGVGAFQDSFKDSSSAKITLSDGITHIQNMAFMNCVGLKEIQFPATLEYLGADVFNGCTNLETFTMSPGNGTFFVSENILYSNLEAEAVQTAVALVRCPVKTDTTVSLLNDDTLVQIVTGAFEDCTQLQNITLPNSVQAIGQNAFSGCTSLSNVSFPNQLLAVGSNAFAGTNLISVELGTTMLEVIDAYAFANCKVASITLPESLTEIGDYAFYGLSASTVILPENLQKIGAYAFNTSPETSETYKLNNVTFNGAQTQIGADAFFNQGNLIIWGYPGSTAEQYANANGITFNPLSTPNSLPLEELPKETQPQPPDTTLPPEDAQPQPPDAEQPPENSQPQPPDTTLPPEDSQPQTPDAEQPPEDSQPQTPDAEQPPEDSQPQTPDAEQPPEDSQL